MSNIEDLYLARMEFARRVKGEASKPSELNKGHWILYFGGKHTVWCLKPPRAIAVKLSQGCKPDAPRVCRIGSVIFPQCKIGNILLVRSQSVNSESTPLILLHFAVCPWKTVGIFTKPIFRTEGNRLIQQLFWSVSFEDIQNFFMFI